MDEGELSSEQAAWHRAVAKTLFKSTWDLIETPDRSQADDADMLLAAATSRWHWGRVVGPEQTAVGDWQIGHVASLLGMGDLALLFFSRTLHTAQAEAWDGWRLASAHEGMARACTVAGNPDGRARHMAAALAALDREPDEEERQVIADQLATIREI